MDPLEILPEEMWRKVFEGITTLDDLLSAYNTCQLFRSLLSKNQTEWMFQGVLPHLAKYLPNSDILNCRQVCKRVNNAVTTHLECGQQGLTALNNPTHPHCHTPPRTVQVNLNVMAKRRKITPTEALKQFQTEFTAGEDGATAKSPFVSRSLKMFIKEMNTMHAFLEFLEKFGVHIHTLHLTIKQQQSEEDEEERIPSIKIVRFIWNILRHVPNLRKLVVATLPDPLSFIRMEQREAEKRNIIRFLKKNSVPPLAQLQNLHLKGSIYMVNQFLERVYAPQLNKFVHFSRKEFGPLTRLPSNLPNLRELAWHFRGSNIIDEMNKLANLECPSLQRLDVFVTGFKIKFPLDKTVTELIFEAIESCKCSPTRLKIFWGRIKPDYTVQLNNMPFVQELCLVTPIQASSGARCNYSFLLNLTSLRKLKLRFFRLDVEMDVSRLESLGTKKRLCAQESVKLDLYVTDWWRGGTYNSDIWRLLPSIDVIEVEGFSDSPFAPLIDRIYTRAERNRI